eukprot:1101612-Amphidinium_carterae.1
MDVLLLEVAKKSFNSPAHVNICSSAKQIDLHTYFDPKRPGHPYHKRTRLRIYNSLTSTFSVMFAPHLVDV